MFEAISLAWMRYSNLLPAHLSGDDVRLNLAAEVRTRLRQLDIILQRLDEAMAATRPDPDELERVSRFARENYDALQRGELPIEAWIEGTRTRTEVGDLEYIEAWELATLDTEAFYLLPGA